MGGRRARVAAAVAIAAILVGAAPDALPGALDSGGRRAPVGATAAVGRAAGGPAPASLLTALPLRFEANEGQADPDVRFVARGHRSALFLTDEEAVLALAPPSLPRGAAGPAGAAGVLRLRLDGADPDAVPTGLDPLPGTSSTFGGADRRRWRSGVIGYTRVRYAGVYPGVDLVYHGDNGELEYDFVVAPGTDPGIIGMRFDGPSAPAVDHRGDLVIATPAGTVRQRAPRLYQHAGGSRRTVSGGYVLGGDGRVGFRVGRYDPALPLVIDPVLEYATYLGGRGEDEGAAVAVDAAGHVYVTGHSLSIDFPVRNGFQPDTGAIVPDVFVAKLDPSVQGPGGLQWATYLGGAGIDRGTGIAVGPRGEVVVAGTTQTQPGTEEPVGAAFPTTPGALKTAPSTDGVSRRVDVDGFVTTLVQDSTGRSVTLGYSTLLGGRGTEADRVHGVAIDPSGHVLVAGETASVDFPVTAGAYQPSCGNSADPAVPLCGTAANGATDAFLTRLDPTRTDDGVLVYSTFLGRAGSEAASAVAADPAGTGGQAYVTGRTFSGDFPTTGSFDSPGRQLYVTRIDTDPGPGGAGKGPASLVYAARFGGTRSDLVNGIAARAGHAYVTGQTFSPDLPVTPPTAFQTARSAGSDAFVARLDTSGPVAGSLVYATYLGGTTLDDVPEAGTSLAVAADGSATVAGVTGAPDFPVRDAFQTAKGSPSTTGTDAFVARLNATGTELVSGSYLGGAEDDEATGVALDAAGNAHVVGTTASPDLPLLAGSFQGQIGGPGDAFVVKLGQGAGVAPVVTAVQPGGGPVTGGTVVAITGSGFIGTSAVRFGTAEASFSVVSDTRITATSPPGPAGTAPVSVARGPARSLANTDATFTYGADGTWSAVGPTTAGRWSHTATLLADGRVLVVGGVSGTGADLASAELYDPRTADGDGGWSTAAPLATPRSRHTATLLPGGKVLVAGGVRVVNGQRVRVEPAELFDPSAGPQGAWTVVPGPATPRFDHVAELLSTGKVLVAGGVPGPGLGLPSPLGSAELYDPATGQWSATAPLNHPRRLHTASLVAGGRVLVVGGFERGALDATVPPLPAETYDPVTAAWATVGAPLLTPRLRHSATALDDGTVLVAGGRLEFIAAVTASVERLRDATSSTPAWVSAPALRQPRLGHAATRLPGGRVLVTGGVGNITSPSGLDLLRPPLRGAELFDVGADGWRPAGQMTTPRGPARVQGLVDTNGIDRGPTATLLSSSPAGFAADPTLCGRNCGRVLVVGGAAGAPSDLYTPAPTIDAVSPATGPPEGGTRVRISGTGFVHGAVSVSFGGAPATVVSAAYGEMEVVAPVPVAATTVDVVVSNDGGASTVVGAFRYEGPPGAVTDLAASALSESEVRLSFSATGSVARLLPPAAAYVVKQSRTPITDDASFDAAITLCDEGSCGYRPAAVGDVLTRTVTGLRAGTTYYYAVRAVDAAGVRGPISNVAQVTTAGVAPLGPAADCPAVAPAGPGRVVYPAGYAIIGLPERTPAPGVGLLYGWLDKGAGGSYDRLGAGQPLTSGRAYWSWSPCPRAVTTSGSGPVTLRMPLGAYRASLVGNPSGTAPARVSGFDHAARWDPTLGNGAGGYRISAFRAPQTLGVGEGMWVFSFTDTTVVFEAP